MTLIRLFMTTCYTLAIAGEFALLGQYMTLVGKILAANEAVIIPGVPFDKPLQPQRN